jgi:hypothetical protein
MFLPVTLFGVCSPVAIRLVLHRRHYRRRRDVRYTPTPPTYPHS